MELQSTAPMKIARQLVSDRWSRGRMPLLRSSRQGFFVWEGNRWNHRDEQQLRNEMWLQLEDATYWKPKEKGVWETVPYRPDKTKVSNVLDALRAITWLDAGEVPMWLGEEGPDAAASRLVAFEDVLVDVEETARRGVYVVYPRGPEFFGLSVLPCKWEEAMARGCPVWANCQQEWSCGDEKWIEVRERLYGCGLTRDRRYAKWLLEFGKPRSGKGTGTNLVLKRLLGRPAFIGKEAKELAGPFGLDRVDLANVLVVSEVDEVSRSEGRALTGLLKRIVGGDEASVNVKYQRQQAYTVLRCLPVLQCNEVPDLPDSARGLVSKMVPLHFANSFVGKEDIGLDDKLEEELPGIARRLVDAYVRWHVDGGKLSLPRGSRSVVESFEHNNNPIESFLGELFVQNPNGMVGAAELMRLRDVWEAKTGVFWRNKDGDRLHSNRTAGTLIEKSSWPLQAIRRNDQRYVKGLSIRYGVKDSSTP